MPEQHEFVVEEATNGFLLTRPAQSPTFYPTLSELMRALSSELSGSAEPALTARMAASQVVGELGGKQVDGDAWLVSAGSARVRLVIVDREGRPPFVHVWAPVVKMDQMPTELTESLLRANAAHRLGSFGLVREGSSQVVVFQEQMLAGTVTADELRAVLTAVATTADQVDDQIVEKFGGRTAIGDEVEPEPEPDQRQGYGGYL